MKRYTPIGDDRCREDEDGEFVLYEDVVAGGAEPVATTQVHRYDGHDDEGVCILLVHGVEVVTENMTGGIDRLEELAAMINAAAAAPTGQPQPACQACGDTATRYVPEEATELPGAYCADCGPGAAQPEPYVSALDPVMQAIGAQSWKCSRCGSESAMACNGMGCFAAEGQDEHAQPEAPAGPSELPPLPTPIQYEHREPRERYTAEQTQTYARSAIAEQWVDWMPTTEAVNALPAALRSYVHGLETRCDPAGLVMDNTIKTDLVRALEASNRSLRDQLATPAPELTDGRTQSLLIELEYAIEHGWPQNSLSRLARAVAIIKAQGGS